MKLRLVTCVLLLAAITAPALARTSPSRPRPEGAIGSVSLRGPGGRNAARMRFSPGVTGSPVRSSRTPAASSTLTTAPPARPPLTRVSDDDGITSTVIPPDQSGTVFVDSQTEPWVDVNPENGQNIVGMWQEDRWSTGGARNLVFGTSADGGQSWTNIALQGVTLVNGGRRERATDPWLDFGPNNTVHATSLAFDDTGPVNAIFVSTSTDGGSSWGPPVTVIRDTRFRFFNDKQALVADDSAASRFTGNVYVTWDRLKDLAGDPFVGRFNGHAMVSVSTDAGASFSPRRVIFRTGPNEQTIGNVPVVLPRGNVVVGGLFIDARGRVFFYVVRSRDGGVTWSKPRLIMRVFGAPIDNVRASDGLPSLAVDRRNGNLYAAWDDARFSRGARTDILVIRSTDGGRTWSKPVRANDTPPRRQGAFTPAVQVNGRGVVGVAYYDLRADPSPFDPTIVTREWFAVSRNGGRTFGPSRALTRPFDMVAASFAGGFFLGDYQPLGTTGRLFQPFFVANLRRQPDGGPGSDVFSTRVTP